MHSKVLFFSIWRKAIDNFKDFVQKNNYDKQYDFTLVDPTIEFKTSSDLLLCLDEMASDDKSEKELKRMTVIIDYLPFFSKNNCEGFETSSVNIRNAILGYPEVLFLFDESHFDDTKIRFHLFLFNKTRPDDAKIAGHIYQEYHIYKNNSHSPFSFIENKRSNLFDGTNLRFALKFEEYEYLKVEVKNFRRIQESRRDNLVLCVEEERTQNRFNSYAAFANGCRVLPIMTASELKHVNSLCACKNNSFADLRLIIRDYDLQFCDGAEDNNALKIDGIGPEENLIDYIRGAKDTAKKTNEDGCWVALKRDDYNHFWNNMSDIYKIFVSKGVSHLRIITSIEKYLRSRNIEKEDEAKKGNFNTEYQVIQYLRGFEKPVNGIYHSFQNIDFFKTRFSDGVSWGNDWDKDNSIYDFYISTDRKNHDHGVPLDIYELTKGMIDRAHRYYYSGKYVLASIVSQEAIEVLNGFHESLALKAYHIHAISENAICMNILGGNEDWLRDDAYFRINKIKDDVDRLLAKKGNSNRRELIFNILNQIYSDCRAFCREREHFKSEEAFISAMGHLNEGVSFSRIHNSIRDLSARFSRRCDEELLLMEKTLSETIKNEESSLYIGDGLFINNPEQLRRLKKNKRKYKRLFGKELNIPVNDSPKAHLSVGTNARIGVKRKKKSLFEKITWESSNSDIAMFDGDIICAQKPGSVELRAKIGKEVLKIEIEIKDNAQITYTE